MDLGAACRSVAVASPAVAGPGPAGRGASRTEAVQRFADAAERAFAAADDEPFEPSVGRASSLLANIPAHIALCRGFAAQYRGDAEAIAALASRARAELGEDERLLDYEPTATWPWLNVPLLYEVADDRDLPEAARGKQDGTALTVALERVA